MRRFISTSVLSLLLLAVSAAPAVATPAMNPTNHNFGTVGVGGQSAAFPFMLSHFCAPDPSPMPILPCLIEPPYSPDPSVTGDFVITSENCPALMLAPMMLGGGDSCSINVAFRPTTAGARSGTLNGSGTGPAAALSGTGLAAPATPTPTPVAGGTPTVEQPKKCKKKKGKKGASAAKKCKKRKKGK